MERKFDRTKDCAICLREIDEITVRLKKLTIGGDTYRQYGPDYLSKTKYEKICVSCSEGKTHGKERAKIYLDTYDKKEEKNDLL